MCLLTPTHLSLVGRCRLKLKNYHISSSQKTSHKYNIEMLKDEETRNIRKDRKNFVNDLARQAEEAVSKGDLKDLYSITRTLAGVRSQTDLFEPKAKRCSPIKKSRELRKTLVNRLPPSEMPDEPLPVNDNRPGKAETNRVIQHLKNSKAYHQKPSRQI